MYPNKTLSAFLTIVVLLSGPAIKAGEDRQPTPLEMSPPVYPSSLKRDGVQGLVVLEFIIGPDGLVKKAQVIRSTNSGFDQAALKACFSWRFNPGLKDGRAVPCRVQQSLSFHLPAHELVYPFSELQAGQDGTATLGFWLDEHNRLKRVVVLKASNPVFGKAALANLEDEYARVPQLSESTSDGMHRTSTFAFKSDGSGSVEVNSATREILRLLKKQGATFLAEADLDKPVVSLEQEPPVFPLALRESYSTATAVVEFFIDRKGHAQLPRVVSASHEDFGYAAVQAVGQWRFEPPRKNKKAVIVRVQVPINFRSRTETKPEPHPNLQENQP